MLLVLCAALMQIPSVDLKPAFVSFEDAGMHIFDF